MRLGGRAGSDGVGSGSAGAGGAGTGGQVAAARSTNLKEKYAVQLA